MEVWVQGAGTVSFFWRGSSEEDFDYLEFYVDGVRKDRISGSVDWQLKSYSVTGTGTHSLLWQYTKACPERSRMGTAAARVAMTAAGWIICSGLPRQAQAHLPGRRWSTRTIHPAAASPRRTTAS
jgi:hypothetical protein